MNHEYRFLLRFFCFDVQAQGAEESNLTEMSVKFTVSVNFPFHCLKRDVEGGGRGRRAYREGRAYWRDYGIICQ